MKYECILCGKVLPKFADYDAHIKSDHTQEEFKQKCYEWICEEYEDVILDYKSALLNSDIYIKSKNLVIDVFPKSPRNKLCCFEFNKPYLEIWAVVDKADLSKQIRRVLVGLEVEKIYTDEECLRDIALIDRNPGSPELASFNNKLIYKFQPIFYENENKVFMHNPVKRRKLIENRKKYLFKEEHQIRDREFISGMKIAGIYRGYSHFNPLLLKWVCNEFFFGRDTRLYLPCCGWGHKLWIANNVEHIYAMDNNEKIFPGLQKMVEFCGFKNVDLVIGDAETAKCEQSNATFVCPPYFNTEIYKEEYKTYDDYVKFVQTLLRNSFDKSSSKRLGVVIDMNNSECVTDMYPNCHAHLLRTMKSHLTPFKGNEEVLIYVDKDEM